MHVNPIKPTNVNDYISQFREDIQILLEQMRETIRNSAPEAEEYMGYGLPGYKLYGKPLVYFAAFKNHIGFYATPSGHIEFAKELAHYKQGKGSVQFPLGNPLPLDLITRIVEFRCKENLHKSPHSK